MFAYREDLRQTFQALYIGPIKKFEKLWPRWILGTPHDPNTLWPLKSIVSRSDIEYAAARQGFFKPVTEVMSDLDKVYKRHCDLRKFTGNTRNRTPQRFVLLLSKQQLDRYRLLTSENEKVSGRKTPDNLLAKLCGYYESLCGKSNHMAVPSSALRVLQPNLIEIFGSPFNTVGEYCSPLLLEKEFCKSLGSAFDVLPNRVFQEGSTLHINPPFDVDMIDQICSDVDGALQRSQNMEIYVILPCWDNELQDLTGLSNFGAPLKGYRMLQSSSFLVHTVLLDRISFPFYDHFSRKFAFAGHVVLSVLTNKSAECHAKVIQRIEKFLSIWSSHSIHAHFGELTYKKEPSDLTVPSPSLQI
jgi:hypothetical protein